MKTDQLFPPIPADTARTARAVFGSSNLYMTIGDRANRLFDGLPLSDPGRLPQKPGRLLAELYLITIFQFLEALPDFQAVNAIRERRDWKYALHLPLTISGFEPSMLCEFRKSLLADAVGRQSLGAVLFRLAQLGAGNGTFLSQEPREILLQVCLLSRLARSLDAFRQALEAVALKRPDWLRAHSLPHWYERFGSPHRDQYLRADHSEQERLALAIGVDGLYLLDALAGEPALAGLPEVATLRQVWGEQYEQVEGKVLWRPDICANCSETSGF